MRMFFSALVLTKFLLVARVVDAHDDGGLEKSLRGGNQLEFEMYERYLMEDDEEQFNEIDALSEEHRHLGAYDESTYLGCYADTPDRSLPTYIGRNLNHDTCKRECTDLGAAVFGMQSHGECWCGFGTYRKHGRTKGCQCDAKNVGAWKQCVYLVNTFMGCFNDQADRAVPYFVGSGHTLSTCTKACRMQGYHFMARQRRDECWCGGSSPLDDTHAKYGEATYCGCEFDDASPLESYKSCVYRVTQSHFKGCWSDSMDRALPVYVGKKMSYDDCFNACERRGHTLMGRQANEECWCGSKKWFDPSYAKHGPATGCECRDQYIGFWKQCIYRVAQRDEYGNILK